MTVLRDLSRYKLDLVRVQEVDGRAVAQNLLGDTHSSTEREMRIMN
jgi:hypothetical protein